MIHITLIEMLKMLMRDGWSKMSKLTQTRQWVTGKAVLMGIGSALLHIVLILMPLKLSGQRYKATHKDGDVQAAWNASLVERYRYSGRHIAWSQ